MMVAIRKDALESELARRSLTQEELAQMMGTHPTYVSHIMTGRKTPGRSFRRRLLKVLNLGFDDLFTIIPEPVGSHAGGHR